MNERSYFYVTGMPKMAACVLEDDSPLLFTVFIFLPELEPVDNNLGIRPF